MEYKNKKMSDPRNRTFADDRKSSWFHFSYNESIYWIACLTNKFSWRPWLQSDLKHACDTCHRNSFYNLFVAESRLNLIQQQKTFPLITFKSLESHGVWNMATQLLAFTTLPKISLTDGALGCWIHVVSNNVSYPNNPNTSGKLFYHLMQANSQVNTQQIFRVSHCWCEGNPPMTILFPSQRTSLHFNDGIITIRGMQ